MVAVECNSPALAKWLLERGADAKVRHATARAPVGVSYMCSCVCVYVCVPLVAADSVIVQQHTAGTAILLAS